MKNARPKTTGTSAAAKPAHSTPPADLFPDSLPPVLAATWPTSGTRAHEALHALFTGPQNQADYRDGWRLAAYIRELVELGWCFIRHDITKPNCRRPITEYRIDRADPGTAAALASRQKGAIDATLAGLLAFAAVCAGLLMGVPL